MSRHVRPGLCLAAVGLVGAVSLVGTALGPPGSRTGLLIFSVLAVAMAVQAVSSEPRDLVPAILLALVPVVALASEGAPAWLGAPLAVLLLLAGEVAALSWEVPSGEGEGPGILLSRLWEAVVLAALGLGAALAVGAAGRFSLVDGTLAVGIGSASLVVLGWLLFSPEPTE